MKDADVAPVFADLKEFLPKFYKEVEAKQANMDKPVFEPIYDVEKQKRLSRLVSNKMGYDRITSYNVCYTKLLRAQKRG